MALMKFLLSAQTAQYLQDFVEKTVRRLIRANKLSPLVWVKEIEL